MSLFRKAAKAVVHSDEYKTSLRACSSFITYSSLMCAKTTDEKLGIDVQQLYAMQLFANR